MFFTALAQNYWNCVRVT